MLVVGSTNKACQVHGVDVSKRMIELAQRNHPNEKFEVKDITTWIPDQKYDLVYAWDSLFHLPLGDEHKPVVQKLCAVLNPRGILMYTFGNAIGEHTDQWMRYKLEGDGESFVRMR